MSAWDTLASSPGDTSKYLLGEKVALATGNSTSDASEKMGCLLTGCSKEEGLHLYSFQECKFYINPNFAVKKKTNCKICYCFVVPT